MKRVVLDQGMPPSDEVMVRETHWLT